MDSARIKAAEFQTEFEDNYFGVQTDKKTEEKRQALLDFIARRKNSYADRDY